MKTKKIPNAIKKISTKICRGGRLNYPIYVILMKVFEYNIVCFLSFFMRLK